jgi:flagellar motor switch protein FliM
MIGSLVSVADLLKFQVGDIVRLDNSVADESSVTVHVCGKPKFKAKQGRIGNKQAIQIISRIE